MPLRRGKLLVEAAADVPTVPPDFVRAQVTEGLSDEWGGQYGGQ